MSLSIKHALRGVAFSTAQFPTDFKCPSPEDIAVGVKYSFTYNLNDLYSLAQGLNLQHAKVVNFFDMVNEIVCAVKGCGITMYPEVSKRGRVHFHGYITVTDKMLFYMHDVNHLALHGNFEVDTIGDPLIWDLYINKNRELTYDWLKYVKVDHLNYHEISSSKLLI